MALSGSLLSIQRSSWLYALGLPSAGLVVLEGRGVHLGACGFVIVSGSEWDPREDELRCKGDRVRGEGGNGVSFLQAVLGSRESLVSQTH